jgi:arylsulfatase
MLAHFDLHLGRLVDVLETTGQLENTIVVVTSDNGASQEGGPLGFVNAMGPFNMVAEPMEQKIARIDDIGGPDTHSNFPHGWAMAANTPLKRYKQNTHGGGVRDALVISAPERVVGAEHAGTLRHQFCHVSDLTPPVLELVGIEPVAGMTGVSFAGTLARPDAETGKVAQYFEMFGHRGIWHDGWKAVAYHAPGTPFDEDRWELYDLAADMNEVHDLAAEQPERLAALQARWWEEAAANKVLPLDDRFGERFAENAARHAGDRTRFTFWSGMGHVPSDVAPDLRSRSYRITAHVHPSGSQGAADGVLIAHGDATSGYSLFVRDGYLVHDLNIGGTHQVVASDRPIPPGATTLGFAMERRGEGPFPHGTGTLLIDGEPAGGMETDQIFWLTISWSGLDIGLDRGTTVADYDGSGQHMGPYAYTGQLVRVTVDLMTDQDVDHDEAGAAGLARE